MDVTTFRVREDGSIGRVGDGDHARSLVPADGSTWSDVTGTEQEWARVCADELDLTSFGADLMSRHRQIAFGLVTHDAASFRVPILGPSTGDDAAGPYVVDELSGVCLGDRLVTFHTRPSPSIDNFVSELLGSPERSRIDSISDLVAALLGHLSFDLVDAGHRLRERIDALTKQADRPDGAPYAAELHDVGALFHDVDSAVGDYRQVLKILAGARTDVLDLSSTIPPLGIAVGNVEALADDVRVYDARLDRLRDQYEAHLQERVNHRINILTLISAIFLPLSLLAGIWGMNFEHMPGIGLRWGFAIMMAAMVAIAAGLGWFFGRRHWF